MFLYELLQYLQGLIHIVLFSSNAVHTIVSVKLKSGPFEAHMASNSPLVKFSYFFNGIPVRFLKNSTITCKLLTGEVERHQIDMMAIQGQWEVQTSRGRASSNVVA